MGYDNLVISIKSSDVLMCVRAHELIADRTDHPIHVLLGDAGDMLVQHGFLQGIEEDGFDQDMSVLRFPGC